MHMKGKSMVFLTKTEKGSPTKRAGKPPKKATCVYEGQYVPMNGKSEGFLTKTDRGPSTKKTGKSAKKSNLCL